MVTEERCGRSSVCRCPHTVRFAHVGGSDTQVIPIVEQHLCLAETSLSFAAPHCSRSSYHSLFLYSPLQLSWHWSFTSLNISFPWAMLSSLQPPLTIDFHPASIGNPLYVCDCVGLCMRINIHLSVQVFLFFFFVCVTGWMNGSSLYSPGSAVKSSDLSL